MSALTVEIDEATATFTCDPAYGRKVVFEVRERVVTVGQSRWTQQAANRFVVGLKGSDEQGFSTHRTFEAAFKAANLRATRYFNAYSVPRGVAA